jgi:hypothetical protein
LATAPSLLSLHKRLIDKFNVGGYWWGPHTTRAGDIATWGHRVATLSKDCSELDTYYKVITPLAQPVKPIRLQEVGDYGYWLGEGWETTLLCARHCYYRMWPEHNWAEAIPTGRLYRQYRPLNFWGKHFSWVPVIRRKFGDKLAPNSVSKIHKFVAQVSRGGGVIYGDTVVKPLYRKRK